MSKVAVDQLTEGDVLSKDVVVGETTLFEKGSVLIKKYIEILTVLKVKVVEIEGREGGHFRNLKEAFQNVDNRFSYVEDNEFMMSIKYLVKDVMSNQRGYR
ncbi:MAG: hypothetical protein J7M24_05180 [Candidatus Latescibacteria bacterium]|nr:hypothetical protein [Candidatus Latescibacterota bacterium]